MARPRSKLARYNPALAQEIAGLTLEDDLGVQVQNVSLAANSAASVNIILNSLLTSNVVPYFFPHRGYSYHVTFAEVTDPTRSAVFLSLFASGISAAVANVVIPGKVLIFQRGE